MDQSIKSSRLLRRARRTKNPEKKKVASKARNDLKTLIINKKKSFFNDYFKTFGHDSKKFWAGINSIVGGAVKDSSDIRVIDPVTGILGPVEHTADIINTFFTGIGPKLASQIANVPDMGTLYENEYESNDIGPVTTDIVIRPLKEVDVNKSSGCLELNTQSYLCALGVFTEQLTHLFNLSLKTCCLPGEWKRGLVTPIPKKGDLTNLDNWSPNSITHLFGKLLEKYVAGYIDFLEEHDIITPGQMGFHKGFCTLLHASAQVYVLRFCLHNEA